MHCATTRRTLLTLPVTVDMVHPKATRCPDLVLVCRSGGGSSSLVAKDARGNTVTKSGWLQSHPHGDHSLVQGLKVCAICCMHVQSYRICAHVCMSCVCHSAQLSHHSYARVIQDMYASETVVHEQAASFITLYPVVSLFFWRCMQGDPTYLIVTDLGIESYGLNSICTHLGCVVPWNAAGNNFKCPCHGSQYSAQGAVVRGPAPLPLALAHMSVKDDVVTLSNWTETDFRTDTVPWWL